MQMIYTAIIRKSVCITFLLGMFITTCYAQLYEKPEGNIRMMTYNVAYCKSDNGGTGSIAIDNIKRIGAVIRALDPDVISIQELDSGAISRGKRFLLEDIKSATGTDYQVIYGNACPFNYGSIGCGILIKKDYPVLKIKKTPLPGDEARILLRVETEHFIFMATHLDLNTEKRVNSAAIINNELNYVKKPVFLAGDLNDSHRWSGGAFASFFSKKFDIFSTNDYTISNANNKSTIDYVLYYNYKEKNLLSVTDTRAVRGNLHANGITIHTEIASDHLPVYVDVKFNGQTGINENIAESIRINQEQDHLYIQNRNNQPFDCKIYNTNGSCLYTSSLETEATISTADWTTGIYFLQIIYNNQILNSKFIKQ